jgi:hypothetical protein
VFRPIGNGDCSSMARCAYVSEITEPDGTRFTFDYAATGSSTGGMARLTRVTSSRGYALLLEGSGNIVTKACVLNLAQISAPANGLCPPGVPERSTPIRTADPPSPARPGRTMRRPASPTPGEGIDGTVMGFVKPGQAAPWLTNHFHIRPDELEVPQEIVDSQAFADGQTYTYKYDLSPFVTYKPQALAGGSYTDALGEKTGVKYGWPVAPGANYPGSECPHQPCSPPMPDDMYTTYVYQQTPGPAAITDPLGASPPSTFATPRRWPGLPPRPSAIAASSSPECPIHRRPGGDPDRPQI